jgi:hypothetical protein
MNTNENMISQSKRSSRKIMDSIKVKMGNVVAMARALVVPRSFWAMKYDVSPITCPKRKLMMTHDQICQESWKIKPNVLVIRTKRINVTVPMSVLKKLIKIGDAWCSVFRNITLLKTKHKLAPIASNSPAIRIQGGHNLKIFWF